MIPHSVKVELLEVVHFTWFLCNKIIFIIISLYYHLLSLLEQANKTSDLISFVDVPDITDLRIPKHIAMSFTNETNHLDLVSIAKLLCWCKQLSISYITLYDDLGRLKDKQRELIKCFESIMRTLDYNKPITVIDGLNIISNSDGRDKFVEDARMLVKLEPEDINLDTVQQRVGWPSDPDLLISFGSPLCLYGFPPWQLRLTEL
jgi:undecaprenyl pyrophosphate synthase